MDIQISKIEPGPYGTIKQLIKFNISLSSKIAQRNLAFNQQFEINGLINGQGVPPVASMRYGIVNVGWSGLQFIMRFSCLAMPIVFLTLLSGGI